MQKSFFQSVRSAKTVGNGTTGELIAWLERYIKILFPENGIEYFAPCKTPDLPVPKAGFESADIHHTACYVRMGNESPIIEVMFVLYSGQAQQLTWVKSFDKEETCWLMARAISRALNSVFFWHELPEIVEMFDKLPRRYAWETKTTLTEPVQIQIEPMRFRVSAGTLVLEDRDLSDVPSPHLQAEALAEDWQTVLKACGAQVIEPVPDAKAVAFQAAAKRAYETAKARWEHTVANGGKTECIIETTDIFEGLSAFGLPTTDKMERVVDDALGDLGYHKLAAEAFDAAVANGTAFGMTV